MADESCMLEIYECDYAEGDKSAALVALAHCFKHDLPIPEWVKDAVSDSVRRFRKFDFESWDEVFGKPHRGRKVSHLRRERALKWEVFGRVQAKRRERPKPPDIFQIVADELKISRATCRRYFDGLHRFTKRPT
jgi:hypothetical protein